MADRVKTDVGKLIRYAWNLAYRACILLLYPANCMLAARLAGRKCPNSVLHISFMGHQPYYTARLLRRFGMKSDYLAVGTSPTWGKCDYQLVQSIWPPVRALQEFQFFWRVAAKYEIFHSHYALTLSTSGWELEFLKRMGRKIVVHYRGCEIRDREENMALHPDTNICQNCDYHAAICSVGKTRCRPAKQYGDHFLVTTPDMKDFVPQAEHLPLFAPDEDAVNLESLPATVANGKEFKIVHATNHPGLEGTEEIRLAIDRLREKGYRINFVHLRGVRHERVLSELKDASLTIGKMKMGYYANHQIESMLLGVPAITCIRPEFLSQELQNSGFIFSTLSRLEDTLEYYLSHPAELEKKKAIARQSILRLHDNEKLGRRLMEIYSEVRHH